MTSPGAIAAGIDDFEHGPVSADSEFVAGKQADDCPNLQGRQSSWLTESIDGPRVTSLIRALVASKTSERWRLANVRI